MLKSVFDKGLIFTILILFIGTNVLPNISGNAVDETNNHNVIYPQKINNHDILLIYFHRIYFFGPIYNLTIDNDTRDYEFESNNLRELDIHFFGIGNWEISYRRMHNVHRGIGGFRFRGILKPTFICGFFY
jgi:hypothetical protein